MNTKKMIITTLIALCIMLYSVSVYAMSVPPVEAPSSTPQFVSDVINIFSFIAWAVAFGMILVMGIKYMSRGAGYKADTKEMLTPYLIGVLCLAFTSTIIKFVVGLRFK